MSKNKIHSLIIGHKGQDGTLLQALLNQERVSWLGIDRSNIDVSGGLLLDLPEVIDIGSLEQVQEIVRKINPEVIYYLAAYHCSSIARVQFSEQHFRSGLTVNVQGPLNFLEAIAKCSLKSKFLYVSSSLIYAAGASSDQPITELNLLAPAETYAFEKILAGHYCREYRDKYDVFASVVIPFNHESVYRPVGFFTRDVTDAIAQIRLGKRECWEVGSLDTIVDWLYAGDVVRAMQLISKLDKADDFIVASGVGHTTGEFIKIACDYAGVDFTNAIRVNAKGFLRKNNSRVGDASKLKAMTGWQPAVGFSELVKQLMQAAIDRSLRSVE